MKATFINNTDFTDVTLAVCEILIRRLLSIQAD